MNFFRKSFPHPSNLRTHVDIVHLGIKNHVCDTCNKAYVTERELIYHMDTTSKCNKSQNNVMKCDKCELNFEKMRDLIDHYEKEVNTKLTFVYIIFLYPLIYHN